MKICEIADIRAGYSFREAVLPLEHGDLPVIQFKDIKGSVVSSFGKCAFILSENIKPYHFLKFNDILLSNRGSYRASVLKCDGNSIATGVFFVLTLKNNDFLPEFVVAYLNSLAGQKELLSRQNKSGVKAIIRSEVEQIDIPLMPIERQKKLVDLIFTYQKEVEIIESLQTKKRMMINFIINRELKEHKNG